MSYFVASLVRSGSRWSVDEADLADCESLDDLVDVLRDLEGDVRLLVIEQDDEYAAIVRLDADEDDPRAFLTDGHAADRFPMAAIVAEDLVEIGAGSGDDADDDADDELVVAGAAPVVDPVVELAVELAVDAPPVHDSAPFGDADIVEDLGTAAAALLALCEHEGTLPVDVLVAVCAAAGCGEEFEELRG
jgi:putative tRNA adenosine deaminase-associated protein